MLSKIKIQLVDLEHLKRSFEIAEHINKVQL